MYLFLAPLGLQCFVQTFFVMEGGSYSSLQHAVLSWYGLAHCRAWAGGAQAEVLARGPLHGLGSHAHGLREWAQELWCTSSPALQHVGSSLTRDRTRVSPVLPSEYLTYCTTREVLTVVSICISLMAKEKAMAPHSSTLVWKIPWMEEPGRLQSMGSRRVGHD